MTDQHRLFGQGSVISFLSMRLGFHKEKENASLFFRCSFDGSKRVQVDDAGVKQGSARLHRTLSSMFEKARRQPLPLYRSAQCQVHSSVCSSSPRLDQLPDRKVTLKRCP